MKCFYLSIFIITLLVKYGYSQNNAISKCPNSYNFANCLECKDSFCLKCNKGYFLHISECLNICPIDYYANNFTKTCTKKPVEASYLKVFTVSRCVNKCGVEFSDCSCSLSCTRKGDCCSDFKVCEIIKQNYNDQDQTKKIDNCKFDSGDNKICLQCKDGFYLYHGKCYTYCPSGTTPNQINNICLSSEVKTQKCQNGTFNHQGKCVETCPKNFSGNRINNTCVKSDKYSFHWIFPSKSTCKNECGKIANSIKFSDRDCSCDEVCTRRGDCCDDYEHFCVKSNKNNFNKITNKKPALRKIRQDDEDDLCDLENINKIISPKQNIKNTNDVPTTHKNLHEFDFNKMQEYLFSLIPKFNSDHSGNNNQHSAGFGSYLTIDGNSTINVYKGNKNLKIVNSHTKNIHSHNTRKIVRENTGSNNIIKGSREEFRGFDIDEYLKMKRDHEDNIKSVKNFIKVANDKLSNHIPTKIVSSNTTNSTSFNKDYSESLQVNKNNVQLNLNPDLIIPTNETENQNKTKIIHYKNYYVHNNIYIDDKSLSMMNPKNPNVFNITKNNYHNHEDEIQDKSQSTEENQSKNVTFINNQNSDNLMQQLENSEIRKKKFLKKNVEESNQYSRNQQNIDTMIIIKNREDDQEENNEVAPQIQQKSNFNRKNLIKSKFPSNDIINEFHDFNELNKHNAFENDNS
jgi:hypothetical protein